MTISQLKAHGSNWVLFALFCLGFQCLLPSPAFAVIKKRRGIDYVIKCGCTNNAISKDNPHRKRSKFRETQDSFCGCGNMDKVVTIDRSDVVKIQFECTGPILVDGKKRELSSRKSDKRSFSRKKPRREATAFEYDTENGHVDYKKITKDLNKPMVYEFSNNSYGDVTLHFRYLGCKYYSEKFHEKKR